MRVNPDALPNGDVNAISADITIRYEESIITLPAGSSAEAIANLVTAVNRYA